MWAPIAPVTLYLMLTVQLTKPDTNSRGSDSKSSQMQMEKVARGNFSVEDNLSVVDNGQSTAQAKRQKKLRYPTRPTEDVVKNYERPTGTNTTN